MPGFHFKINMTFWLTVSETFQNVTECFLFIWSVFYAILKSTSLTCRRLGLWLEVFWQDPEETHDHPLVAGASPHIQLDSDPGWLWPHWWKTPGLFQSGSALPSWVTEGPLTQWKQLTYKLWAISPPIGVITNSVRLCFLKQILLQMEQMHAYLHSMQGLCSQPRWLACLTHATEK